jgi:hypothetical protein
MTSTSMKFRAVGLALLISVTSLLTSAQTQVRRMPGGGILIYNPPIVPGDRGTIRVIRPSGPIRPDGRAQLPPTISLAWPGVGSPATASPLTETSPFECPDLNPFRLVPSRPESEPLVPSTILRDVGKRPK